MMARYKSLLINGLIVGWVTIRATPWPRPLMPIALVSTRVTVNLREEEY